MTLQTVYLNGDFMPMEQARISPLDRGFLFADGVYEVIPVYQGQLFEWEAHYQRLENSLAGVFINNPMDNQAWLSVLQQLISLHPWQDQFIYLQISRGQQIPRDHLPQADLIPTVFAYTNPLKPLADSIISHGIKVITLEDIRWQRCDIKSIALLPNVMAKMQAQAAGVDDVILVNQQGYVTEGSASNMMMVKAGEIITPPLSAHILPGVTRQVIEKIANRHHIPFIEREIHQTELDSADELWLASSTKEALPICQLNGQPVADGQPGAIWKQLRQLYQNYKIQTRTRSTI
ncbi:D-amino acid aminotransferase [Thiomicrospira microaerophila]|uniref:D-amino acid aminotransferase n=1 Tax=Thiomicrospira microaerophila TaxID=406020 RepID=UPI00200E8787|nr:D-amino acid aminotransferase [Thiomicrospira microaerophila]UQB41764.1 D-amino acid aminotransferase [Thiomicrospira microaerophila]